MPNVTTIQILAVDDEPDICILTKEFLYLKGEMEVSTAHSVEEARKALAATHYDAIVSDYQMLGENGIQFLRSLRAAGDNIPFILLTCKEREEVIIDALNYGADAYVQKAGKPVTQYVELEHSIRAAVQRRRGEEELKESEARFRELAELLPAAVFEMDLTGTLTYLNRKALEMFGYAPQDFLQGIALLNILMPEEQERGLANIEENLLTVDPVNNEYAARRKDGSTLSISIISAAILRHDKPVGLRGIIDDVTERKRAEESQRIQMFKALDPANGPALDIKRKIR